MTIQDTHLRIGTAVGRWAGLGPYYAMFPLNFVFETVNRYSMPGSGVIDPFAGRGSSVYAAAALGRTGIGIEINPVGWLYGHVKLRPASQSNVQLRIREIGKKADRKALKAARGMSEFFRVCFAPSVLAFLLSARKVLDWRNSRVDATVMALILVYLHGKLGQALSNQMRQTKAMAPDYSVRWWDEQRLKPPDIDPVDFLNKRVTWRYAKGKPNFPTSRVVLGDSTHLVERLVAGGTRFDLLLTSPPYLEITNYHYDQWLRLWMLGGTERPHANGEPWKGKFASKERYRQLLLAVFKNCARLMNDDAVVYVRTDSRPFTFQTTKDILRETFPGKSMIVKRRPFKKHTQTALYGDKAKKPGDIDIILR